jgi:outer membrane protein OmpA-like peptidoglycan-associated protein
MTLRLPHLRVTSLLIATQLALCSSCAMFQREAAQTALTREVQTLAWHRIAQLSFGQQARFGSCVDPACPQVTPKTLAAVPAQANVQPQPSKFVLPASPPATPMAEQPMFAGEPILDFTPALSVQPPSITHELVVSFPFGSSTLTPLARSALDASIAHARSSRAITISGRTDAVGDLQVNQAIAMARALAVRDYFREFAPDISASVSLDAKGRCCFVASNEDQLGRAKNRRVHVVFSFQQGA